jgi:hypothetical protein
MSFRRPTTPLLALCCAVVWALVAAPAGASQPRRLPELTAAPRDALTIALARGRLTEARYALERARSLFALGRVRDEFGAVARPNPHAATPILRDLAARVRDLSGQDRATARSILARPTDGTPGEHQYRAGAILGKLCDPTLPLCVHWDDRTTHGDAPPGADNDASTVPPAAQATLDTFADVYDLEVGLYDYLAPLPDTSSNPDNGGDGRIDIYMANIGGARPPLFGYCTTDDPHAFDPHYRFYDVSAYCVVDEDFVNFGNSQTPQQFREVTAAHEFFHAIQFHYDWFEDLWLMEGTAMFMEDQFADDVNDNVNYLDNSVMKAPLTPVDRGADGFEYGAWIWWRFLVEELGQQSDPQVIREVWESVAGASIDTDGPGPDTVANDRYSLRGVRTAISSHGLAFRNLFGKFAWANRLPSTFYEEGSTYPTAPVIRKFTLGAVGTGTGWRSTRLRHLASTYVSFKPKRSTPKNAVLRVRVDLPKAAHSPKAFLLVKLVGQPWRVREVPLDANGDGGRRAVFGRGKTHEVDLVLTNASPKMRCGRGTPFSCTGVGVDDLRTYMFRGRVRKT